MATEGLPPVNFGAESLENTTKSNSDFNRFKPIIIACGLCAIFGPGAGQLYHRQWFKAAGFILSAMAWIFSIGFYFIGVAKTALAQLLENNPEAVLKGGFEVNLAASIVQNHIGEIRIFKWIFIILWCASIMDAYKTASQRLKGSIRGL